MCERECVFYVCLCVLRWKVWVLTAQLFAPSFSISINLPLSNEQLRCFCWRKKNIEFLKIIVGNTAAPEIVRAAVWHSNWSRTKVKGEKWEIKKEWQARCIRVVFLFRWWSLSSWGIRIIHFCCLTVKCPTPACPARATRPMSDGAASWASWRVPTRATGTSPPTTSPGQDTY